MSGGISSRSPSVNRRGSETQTLSRLTADKVDSRRASLRAQGSPDKDHEIRNGALHYNTSKRNSIISNGHVLGDGKRNSIESLAAIKEQRNNTSLVREGYSALNLNTKPRGKPKAEIPPTHRSYDERGDNMGSQAVPSEELDAVANVEAEDTWNSDQHPRSTSTSRAVKDDNAGLQSHQHVEPPERVSDGPSVRRRFYENADMEDVLQEKVATQLRENGIAETRVSSLSAKICQAVRDDVMLDGTDKSQPQVISNLTSTIHSHLDVILYNYPQHTDLRNPKPYDATSMSQIVLMRVKEIHQELDSCKQNLDVALKSSQRQVDLHGDNTTSTTARDIAESYERSMVMVIKEGIDAQKTDNEILANKIKQLENDGDDVGKLRVKHLQHIKNLDEENWQLKKCLQEADHDNEVLVAKVKEQEEEHEELEKSVYASRRDVELLRKQIGELKSQGRVSAKELAALQSEKARLQVLCDQRLKEILHLRDPDKDMLLQIRELKEELIVLRTQTRRLGEERGMLRVKSQKLESALDEALKTRNKLASERDTLFKECQELRQRYRRLSLATPSQRTLPEIMTPRNGMLSRSTSRSTTRLDPNVVTVRNPATEDSKLSTHREEEQEDGQAR